MFFQKEDMFSEKVDMFSTDLYMFSQHLDINVKWRGENGGRGGIKGSIWQCLKTILIIPLQSLFRN